MKTITPKDATLLALIAENRKTPEAKKLLPMVSSNVLAIAKAIISGRGSKMARTIAKAICLWADTN